MNRLNIIKRLFDTGAQCYFCGKEIKTGRHACPVCQKLLDSLKTVPGKTPERCAYIYGSVTKALIRSIKYDDCPYKAKYAAKLMRDAWINCGAEPVDLLTYVPVHASRKKSRGFDQSRLICQELANLLGIPYDCLFQRVKRTTPQYKLNAAQRKANLADAFTLIKAPEPSVKTVMIIDDIYTTGVTMQECAKLLPNNIKAVPFTLCYDEHNGK